MKPPNEKKAAVDVSLKDLEFEGLVSSAIIRSREKASYRLALGAITKGAKFQTQA